MSAQPPLVGIVGSRTRGDRIVGNLDVLGQSPIDIYYADYAHAVIEAGGLPLYLPLNVAPAAIVARLDGLLMTGGTDIGPERYGAKPHDALLVTVPERDDYELAVLDAAYECEIPTLGICRGLQILNVHAGGTLLQHVPEHAFIDGPGDDLTHEVVIDAGSTLNRLYGDRHKVNSLHHQAANDIGDQLRVAARADDGGVEALEHKSLPIVAVQWHPEMLPTRASDPVFDWLVGQAAQRLPI